MTQKGPLQRRGPLRGGINCFSTAIDVYKRQLTYKKGNHIYLTDEGSHFLSGIQSVLSDYDQLVDECQLIKNDAFSKLTLQDPPFTDKACTAFYELVNSIRRASVSYTHLQHKSSRSPL